MAHLFNTLFNTSVDTDPYDLTDISMDIINQMYGHLDFSKISKYVDIDNYNTLYNKNQSPLNIMHFNIRSIAKNFDQLTALLKCLAIPPDVLAVTETWLTDHTTHLYHLEGYHSYHVTRQRRSQGGVSVFISNKINSTQLRDLSFINEDIEIHSVDITIKSQFHIVHNL